MKQNLSDIKYKAWCSKCHKMVKVDTEVKTKCPVCKEDVDVKGKAINISTSNGPYETHY